VLYDIGANVGAFTLIAAKLCGPRGRVVAFEPGYASFAHLCDNIVLNGCQDTVIPVPMALGSTTALGTFTYRTLHAGQSRHGFVEDEWSGEHSTKPHRYSQPVLSMSLDEIISRFALPTPDYIKLDVDGGELNVLRGAAATLGTPGLRSILIEVDDSLSDEVIRMLAAHRFELDGRHKRDHREVTQVWYGVFRRST